jgi:adenosylcobinamide-phosphate synthase
MLHSFLLKSVFAYRNLRQNVINVGQALVDNNLSQARELTGRHLVSRNTRNLTAEEVAGAAIESLAENLTDSVTAPLMAYAVGSLPAAWAYRFINTADAMWGYRSAEFEQLGKFPARLDDVLNWFPARMTGWLLRVAAWLAGEDAAGAKQVMLTQHNQTTSPNAGWTMSAMAGALGITLSKHDAYQLEGGSRLPTMTIIDRALRLADVCLGLSIAIICSGLMIFDIWRRKYL